MQHPLHFACTSPHKNPHNTIKINNLTFGTLISIGKQVLMLTPNKKGSIEAN
jgi:hypothetical protein